MKSFFFVIFWYMSILQVWGQDDFVLQKQKSSAVIPFKLINNLVFIPIKVNGVELNFILDSGVAETVLFSLEDKKEVNVFNPVKIKLRGLGSENSVEGIKSTQNILETHGLQSTNHIMYIILDQSFNMSSHIGIPVNGIIGYKFFKNKVVKIDYHAKKIFVYDGIEKIKNSKLKKFTKIPLKIELFKPYLEADIGLNGKSKKAKLLVDIGNSDAIWMFQNDTLQLPEKKFEDFLGKGFSGDVLGYRAKIDAFSLGGFEFEKPIAAFPEKASIKNVAMVPDRVGSVGGEILMRFTVIIDYQNQHLYLKKNSNFKNPFQYNHSGVVIQHNGLQWVQETVGMNSVRNNYFISDETTTTTKTKSFNYEFKLKPAFEIANIRKNSAAEKAGLEVGDVVLSINKTNIHRFTLQQINTLLKSDDERFITIEVERKGKILKFKFELINEL
ncbi:PDZ domain-containing protein [Flavobacterium agrisoli]|uniref:PDZ domain-containing protein n=1 Tax=Flavobacterium agrisoli TaxID=2793066 RepID=A0A934PJW7_9FLAO|nr:PDZ domain-containing protein [Flavobacterium agrisoli]MBK0368724.1 PDZ domain-containing protein [Flavobacterium agrisoli]